jgi:hypothetical protein
MRRADPFQAGHRWTARATLAAFALIYFGWLPLGLAGGLARVVPWYSVCGESLCECRPGPADPLWDLANMCGGEAVSERLVGAEDDATAVREDDTRLELGPVEEIRGELVMVLAGLIAAPVGERQPWGVALERSGFSMWWNETAPGAAPSPPDPPPPRV